MLPFEVFLWSFVGSWAVDIVRLYRAFRSNPESLIQRHRSSSFWITGFFMALIGGALAVAMEAIPQCSLSR